jgi:hypothetical protein
MRRRVPPTRGAGPEVGPIGILDVELEAPAIDDDLDRLLAAAGMGRDRRWA